MQAQKSKRGILIQYLFLDLFYLSVFPVLSTFLLRTAIVEAIYYQFNRGLFFFPFHNQPEPTFLIVHRHDILTHCGIVSFVYLEKFVVTQ